MSPKNIADDDNKASDDQSDNKAAQGLGSYSLAAAGSVKTQKTSKPKSKLNWKIAALAISFIMVGLTSGLGGAWIYSQQNDGLDNLKIGNQKKIVTSESKLISQIASNVGPSVVSVNTAVVSQSGFGAFFGGEPEVAEGAGTGVIISKDGYIVTNRHVVPTGTSKVSVTLSDGTELTDVKIVGRTNDSDSLDIAFLKINDAEGKSLTAAALGDSSNVSVGDNVVAIGNALGQFQNTVTSGIISGYGRDVQAGGESGEEPESLTNLFQTDAAINQGNSGGPLVNLNAQVIGINTAIAGGDAQNIGFAIPINDIRGLIDQVIKTGKFERPYLGVRYIPVSADVAKEYELSVNYGAFIPPNQAGAEPSIIPDSPADKAGLQENDVILSVDDKKIDQNHSLTSLLAPHKPGDKVSLSVQRGDKTIKMTATLGSLPSQD